MNADWHRAHVLGSHAPLDIRVVWHEEHARECGCREMPPSIAAEIAAREARGSATPRPSARARE
jgi:hypothetical protein